MRLLYGKCTNELNIVTLCPVSYLFFRYQYFSRMDSRTEPSTDIFNQDTDAKILKKYKMKRMESDLRRRQKWRKQERFVCQHCGLTSRASLASELKLTPRKQFSTSCNISKTLDCTEGVGAAGVERIDPDDICSNNRLKDSQMITSSDGVSGLKYYVKGLKQFSKDASKPYLCGRCYHGFEDVEALVEHVASCSGINEVMPLVDASCSGITEAMTLVNDGSEPDQNESLTQNFIYRSSEAGIRTRSGREVRCTNLQFGKTLSKNLNDEKVVDISKEKMVVKTRSTQQTGYLMTKEDCNIDYKIGNEGKPFSDSKREFMKRVKHGEVEVATLVLKNQSELQEPNGIESNMSVNAEEMTTSLGENVANCERENTVVKLKDMLTNNGNLANDDNTSSKKKVKSKLALNPFCSICSKTFTQKSSLYRHQSLVHKGVKKHECKTCHKRYQQKHNLTLHKCLAQKTPVSKSLLCITCGKHFSSVSSLRHHEKTLHAKTKQFKCPTCGQAFSTAGNMREHLQAVHNGRAYLCDLCGRSFSFKNSYNRHQRYHTGVKPYHCQHCERTFSSREGCQLHAMTHVVTEKVQCEYCGKRMKNLLCVSYHMKKHHVNAESRGFQCYRCKMKCDSNVSLVQHMEECQKNQYVCQCCFKTFSSKSNLNQHLKGHTMIGDEHI